MGRQRGAQVVPSSKQQARPSHALRQADGSRRWCLPLGGVGCRFSSWAANGDPVRLRSTAVAGGHMRFKGARESDMWGRRFFPAAAYCSGLHSLAAYGLYDMGGLAITPLLHASGRATHRSAPCTQMSVRCRADARISLPSCSLAEDTTTEKTAAIQKGEDEKTSLSARHPSCHALQTGSLVASSSSAPIAPNCWLRSC